MKTHVHSEQFDGHRHAWCGRATDESKAKIVGEDEFAATDPAQRCAICDRDQFPRGQPDWHLKAAKRSWSDVRQARRA